MKRSLVLTRLCVPCLVAAGFLVAVASGQKGTTITAVPATTSTGTTTKAAIPNSTDEVKAAVDNGNYNLALQGISHILDPKHAKDYDRHVLLMLRAECELQLKEWTTALALLDAIRKTAHEDAAIKDEYEAASLAFLIRKSSGGLFTPKTGSDKIPINILDRSLRMKSYRRLYADELAACQQLVKESAFGTALAPLFKVCDELFNVQAVEFVVTNDTVETKKVAQQLLVSARVVIVNLETADNNDIVRISNNANRQVVVQGGMVVQRGNGQVQGRLQLVGLGPADVHRLGDIASECDLIVDLINRLRILAGEAEALASVFDRAALLKGNCQIVASGGAVGSAGVIPPDVIEGQQTGGRRGGRRGGNGGGGGSGGGIQGGN